MESIILVVLVVLILFYLFSGNSNKKETIIWFHRPSCPHCVRMQAEWDKFVQIAKIETPDVEIKEVNIEEDPQMAKRYDITSVPFIIKIKPCGKQMVYDGDRTAETLLHFAKNA